MVKSSAILSIIPLCHGFQPSRSPRIVRPISDSDKTIRFFISGDWGGVAGDSDPEKEPFSRSVGESMDRVAASWLQEDKRPNSCLLLGDSFYDYGVRNDTDHRFKDTFQETFKGDSLQNIPMYNIAGNHDYRGNVTAQISYVDPGGRWLFPDWWYSIDYLDGRVEIMFIDTMALMDYPEFEGKGEVYWKEQGWLPEDYVPTVTVDRHGPQYEWLEQRLKESRAEILLVIGHHPVFSWGDSHGSTSELIEELLPFLQQYNVTAYLSGHDHNMQHITYHDEITQYYVVGQATRPKGHKCDDEELGKGSDIVYCWDYTDDDLGAWAIMNITEDSTGMLEASIAYINAINDEVIYSHVLPQRNTTTTSQGATVRFSYVLFMLCFYFSL